MRGPLLLRCTGLNHSKTCYIWSVILGLRDKPMRRRQFITLLGGAATWPLAVHAQQKLPTIGYLGSGTRGTQGEWAAAFVQRLRELGWIDARTVAIEYRWAVPNLPLPNYTSSL